MILCLSAKAVGFQLIEPGVKDDIFRLGIDQQIAICGADGTVAEVHLVAVERRNLHCVLGRSAVAAGVVRDLFGPFFAGGHGCVCVGVDDEVSVE